MKTIVEKFNEQEFDRRNFNDTIKTAAQIIIDGGLVAFPTETVYGLGADALNPQASIKIYEAKGRPCDNPLIIHIADIADLENIVTDIPQKAKLLAAKFWPGPLTMIFPKRECVPLETTGGLDTVAVRMPNHPIALALIKESGGFIAAPSANTSGKPSPTLARHVLLDLDGRIPMILDGGPVGIGIESTIVDFSDKIPMILRPGYITKDMIQSMIGQVIVDPGLVLDQKEEKPRAPGMRYMHYAPKAELILVDGLQENVIVAINAFASKAKMQGKSVGIIGTDESVGYYQDAIVKSIGTRKDEDTIAKHLYGILREFDDLEVDRIYSESFATPRIGLAIMNRLLKAAGQHILKV
ncbi:threonylcarbamoyl-AMP synthase [Lachnospiraceae bacterium ZAX-1]